MDTEDKIFRQVAAHMVSHINKKVDSLGGLCNEFSLKRILSAVHVVPNEKVMRCVIPTMILIITNVIIMGDSVAEGVGLAGRVCVCVCVCVFVCVACFQPKLLFVFHFRCCNLGVIRKRIRVHLNYILYTTK